MRANCLGLHVPVRVVNCAVPCYNGAVGRIMCIDLSDRTPYLVRFNESVTDNTMTMMDMWFKASELEAI